MSDEPTGTPPASPVAPVEPVQSQPTPPAPQKLEGKTPEELIAILQNRDEVIGRQGRELGQVREAVERLYAERSQPREDRPQGGEPKFKFDYEDPVKSVEEIVEARVAKEREAFKQSRLVDVATRTTSAFMEGQESMKQNPHLFEGIEEQVKQGITQVYGPLAAQGQDVSQYLRNPKTWKYAAMAIRSEREEFDRLVPTVKKGMAAGPTDLPSQTRPPQDDDGFIIEDSDRQDFEDLKGKRGTDKEIKELLKLGLGATRSRR